MTYQSIHVAHGNRIIITCGCGREHSIRRADNRETSAFHCAECGVKRLYHWPPAPKPHGERRLPPSASDGGSRRPSGGLD